jgi:biopolymer transport protein ExbB/TolQ
MMRLVVRLLICFCMLLLPLCDDFLRTILTYSQYTLLSLFLSHTTDLKEELAHIQSLLQDEQSMYQTSNQALNLVVEAQHEELKHARAAAAAATHSTTDELMEFDIKAKEYDEAMKESKKVESGSSTSSTSPHVDLLKGM